jgi:hypothetical protein
MEEKTNHEPTGTTLGERKWYRNITALVVLVGGVIGIVTGLFALSQKFFPRTRQKIQQNVEIVLDASTAMNGPFEGGTKRDAAIRSVSNYLHGQLTKAVADEDNLAFRVFGGECNGQSTRVLINFDQGNTSAIEDAARNLQPVGETTLANAVIQASGDFNDERFKGVSKRIIVITGSGDTCTKDDAAKIIRTRLEDMARQSGEKIELDLRFIGLGLSSEQQEQLDSVAKATGGQADFVGTRNELDRALTHFLRVEPVMNDIKLMADILNGVTKVEEESLEAINQNNLAVADGKVADARQKLKQTDLQFEDLGQHQGKDQFQKVFREMYQLAKANREAQAQIISLIGGMVQQRKQTNNDALDKSWADFERLKTEYNNNVDAIKNLQGKVNEELKHL